jgi:uncharacterized protein (TIGR02466 family)
MKSRDIQLNFQKAVALIGRGDLDAAQAALTALLNDVPDHPDGLQLLGVVHRRAGRAAEAIKLFEASLAKIENQPHVHNNLASALLAVGDRDKAERHYRRALALDPAYADAQYNLALMLIEARPGEAKMLLENVIRAAPNNGNAHNALALALNKLDDSQGALVAATRAASLLPHSHTAQHNLGQAAMAVFDYPAAARAYRTAVGLNPASDASWIGLGNALRSQERNEDAKQAYERAIVANPSNKDAHRLFNEMLWQTGETNRYLASFPAALSRQPGDLPLRLAFANELLRIRQPAQAIEELTRAAASTPDSAQVSDTLARAYSMAGDFEQALTHHRRATAGDSTVPAYHESHLQTLLKAERHLEALDLSDVARARFPLDQGILAMHTTALQILGDKRHSRIADFAGIAKVFELDLPEGFSNADSFNRALANELRGLHATKNHPTDQTLRGGTQTYGALFDRQSPLIVKLRPQIRKAVAQFIAEMPDDPSHPFFARKSKSFAFSGSWSACLHEGGFHSNHIHPKGWISSAYYVSVPDEADDTVAHPGWFKMGETNLQLGRFEAVQRLIQPKVGRLVLFPSYFWHGTVPIRSASERMTVAFDVVPRP